MRVSNYVNGVKQIEIGPVQQNGSSWFYRQIKFVTEDGEMVVEATSTSAADLSLTMKARKVDVTVMGESKS